MGSAAARRRCRPISAELEVARRLKLPISVHTAKLSARAGEVAALGDANALGPDMLLAHGAGARPDEIKLMAETRTPIATTPSGEASMGYPLPQQIENFLGAGVTVGLGFDSIALSGNADMFRTMKTVQDSEKIRNQAQFKISSRRVLGYSPRSGAHAASDCRQDRLAHPGQACRSHHGVAAAPRT